MTSERTKRLTMVHKPQHRRLKTEQQSHTNPGG